MLEESEKRSDSPREQRIYHGSDIRFFRTSNGEAYGFTVGGKIYIDPRIATDETPIHEYAHLWATAMREGNPTEWKNIVGLMKGTSVWAEVQKLYPELKNDDDIADEVLATFSGRRGAERLRAEQQKIMQGDGSVFEKAAAVGALARVKQALSKFWKGVADFLGIHYTSAEEVADRVMKDLLEGVDPRKFGEMPTIIDAADTALMRRKTGFGDTKFSDGYKKSAQPNEAALKHLEPTDVEHTTKVQQKREKAKEALENVAKIYRNTTDSKGFISDLSESLGLTKGRTGSGYGSFETPDSKVFTIRVSNHNINTANVGDESVESIVIKTKRSPNRFHAEEGKFANEYVYFKEDIRKASTGTLSSIAESISELLDTGEYRDKTGLAKDNHSPETAPDGDIVFREGDMGLKETKVDAVQAVQKATENLNLGGRVVVHESAEGLEGREATAKGWYDTRTGQIHVVLSNNADAADVTQTILHEAVAHHGLRELFGHNVLDAFLDSVLAAASQEVKDAINELRRGNGWNFRTATEEYLAGLAERTDFECMTAEEHGLFATIRRLFNHALEFLGLKNHELSDRELAYILWCSYQDLQRNYLLCKKS